MALSSIALCARALLKIGAGTITSFGEGTAEAEIAANLYPSTRDALLSSHPWRFATALTSLARLAAPPLADFRNAFQLPPDFLRALSAGIGGRGQGLSYRLAEQRLHCNADAVVLTYLFRPKEEDFPPFFSQALITRLAAEFCIPLTESTARAEMLHKLAEEELRRARLVDSQQDEPARLNSFPLVEVRS
ncbi:hypothetical protein [Telmatospirillum sp. J64-1]|uniref:hypothetical protein n=1 Tax=Telmatospirillum sp. J64-1 TaxID=2502183 RepID=UPI00115ED1CA|nr:hypothetical protein [Telmatospirillum sp. J64-1]